MLSAASQKDPAMSGQLDYERVEGDFYPTPPENVDCLATFVDFRGRVVWEPACGEGHISKRIARYCDGVFSTDLYDRGYGKAPLDFLEATKLPSNDAKQATDIVTNPPFDDLAEQFIRTALELTKPVDGRVCMFLRNEYDMAVGRHELFDAHPAYVMKVCVTKRPRWIAGSTGSPRHNYAWYVWDWDRLLLRQQTGGAVVRYIHPKMALPIGAPEITVQ